MIQAVFENVRRFLLDDEGPTAVEYAVMLMFILLVCITAIQAIGRINGDSLQNSADELTEAMHG